MDSYRLNVEKIRSLSFSKGMSISRTCEKAGMSRSRATEWKAGRRVSPNTVYRIAQVLNADPEELIIKEQNDAENQSSESNR